MCGIFGFQGHKDLDRKDAKLVVSRIKALGLYNVTRGQHSCGIYINGQILKGVDRLKVWDDFIQETILPEPKENFTIICHTRQATTGDHSEKNAHPFQVNDLIGVHNGSISNIWELCNNNDIEHKNPRVQVDSHALYMLIDKLGTDILNTYKGKAALAWTNIKEPNSVYLYHGCSRTTKNGQLEEERPMWTIKMPEGIYFSSMPTALEAIRDNANQKVEILPYNVIFKITNGKFTTSQKNINRENANVPPETFMRSSPATRPSTTNSHTGRTYSGSSRTARGSQASLPFTTSVSIDNPWARIPLIHFETLPPQATLDRDGKNQGRIFFWKGRYWIYAEGNIPKLAHGDLWLTDKGFISSEIDAKSACYYFWDGAMLKDSMAMTAINIELARKDAKEEHWTESKKVNFGFAVSNHAKQPVTCLATEGTIILEEFRNRWYLDGIWPKAKTGSFTPKFSGRFYIIVDGYLQDINSSVRGDKPIDMEALGKYRDAQKMKDTVSPKLITQVAPSSDGDKCCMIPPSLRPPTPKEIYSIDGMEGISIEEHAMTGQGSVSNCKTRDGKGHPSNIFGSDDADAPNDTSIGQIDFPQSLTSVFESVEEAMENLGEIENTALRNYHRDLHIDTLQNYPSEDEISQSVLDTIAKAVRDKQQISVTLDGNNPDILLIYYNEALSEFYVSEQSRAEAFTNDITPTGSYIDGFATLDNDDDELSEEQNDMNQQNDVILEDIGEALVDLKEFSNELGCNTGSSVAMEISHIVQQGISNLAGSLIDIAKKHDKKDFLGKLCKTVDA